MLNDKFLAEQFGINKKVLIFCHEAEDAIKGGFAAIDETAEYNQYKVLKAMQQNNLNDSHFASSTGYGYNDLGRDVLEKIYADVFHTEEALVRPQIISGTHALTIALSGNLKHGDELVYVTGAPYDTLQGVIGIRKTKGSLIERGIIYKQVELTEDGRLDFEQISKTVTPETKIAAIQRSKGYSWRRSFTMDEIKEIIAFIKNISKDIICMVDNCYGEFVDYIEPSDANADMTVGSLIKNPGGGLAPVGGYIAGTAETVENAAFYLTAPGLGREVGPSLGVTPRFMQGLFLAPQVVASSLKGAVFASEIYRRLNFEVSPEPAQKRSDIVQAIRLNSEKAVVTFCRAIQKAAAVDSFALPEPSGMPGYDCPVIMAAGAFVQGSSIELSSDAPVRPPYNVFLQGGLTWFHAKIGVIITVNELLKEGLIII